MIGAAKLPFFGSPPRFTPPRIAGCLLWLAADKITGHVDGDVLSAWADSSGHGSNATLAHGTGPTYKTGQANGLPCLRFSAGDMTAPVVSAEPLTMFLVLRDLAGSGYTRFLSDSESLASQFGWDPSNSIYLYGTTGSQITAARDTTTFHIVGAITNGASSQLYFDGSLLGTVTSNFAIATSVDLGGVAGSGYDHLDYAEVIVYDSALTGPQITQLTAYLVAKYV